MLSLPLCGGHSLCCGPGVAGLRILPDFPKCINEEHVYMCHCSPPDGIQIPADFTAQCGADVLKASLLHSGTQSDEAGVQWGLGGLGR